MSNNHELEIYSPIKEFNGYLITNFGKIFSLKRHNMKKIKCFKNKQGYLEVYLYKSGKNHKKKVHRLVAQAFIPNPDNKPCINHIDEDKTNNNVSNLEWCTYKENNNHGTRTKRASNSRKGVKRSEETREKISSSRKGKYKGEKSPVAKSVIGFKINGCNIKYYKCIRECKKDGFNPSGITLCCRKRYKYHKGYKWFYTDEYFNNKMKGDENNVND